MNVIASWSGGKDSCMACYRAMNEGHNLTHLVNTVSMDSQRVRFHELREGIIQKQADSIGAKLLQIKTISGSYEENFKEGVQSLMSNGEISGMVFGDIHLQSARDWSEKMCENLGLKILEPLWKDPTEELLADFIKSGFEAYVVACSDELMGEDYIGRKIDKQFLKDASELGIDVCGENGEYHTVVTGGPIFKEKIEIIESRKMLRGGKWYLDIVGF